MSSDIAIAISNLAIDSDIATYDWTDRGVAPIGYLRGMAVMFASNAMVCLL